MGNAPSERYMGDQLRCCKCDKVLPPCYYFSDYYQSTIHGRHVYVFNGGEYYRPVGQHMAYECENCFNQLIKEQEKLQREAEERRREEELNQKLEESQQRAQQQHGNQLNHVVLEENKSKQHALISTLDEHQADFKSGSGRDELLESLSSMCDIPLESLSLDQLSVEQLGNIVSALDVLLSDEWMATSPSLNTLQHAQVLITELCVLSMGRPEGLSLKTISNCVQSLVDSISQSADNVTETFLLTRALYLNLIHFFTEHQSSGTDAALIAKLWSEEGPAPEELSIIQFLGTLASSLHSVVGSATVFILKMEIKNLELLLSTLTNLNGRESHSECSKMLLKVVKMSQWTPAEAVTLLRHLSQKYAEDDGITEVLTLIHIYNISPEWKDDAGRSLLQALDSFDPEGFCVYFKKTLRKQDEGNLKSALEQLQVHENLDCSSIQMIKTITTDALTYSENTPKGQPFLREYFKGGKMHADGVQRSLSLICQAVFDSKGWWPTLQQMLRWHVLVLKQRDMAPAMVGVQEDACVIAMFAATQVCMGHKLDLVLRYDNHSHEQTEDWFDFFKYLGISLSTNKKKAGASSREVYEADIVYGTMEDFVCDYLQFGLQLMETGSPHLNRGFIIQEGSISATFGLELYQLKENNALVFAADTLQRLMANFHGYKMEERYNLIKALFLALHTNINESTHTDSKIMAIAQKLGIEPHPNQVYTLIILENLVKMSAGEYTYDKENVSLVGRLCMETLFASAVGSQASKELEMVSNLVAQELWSPAEALNLLETLMDHQHDESNVSIMKILHLMETYQISPEWRDTNNQSVLKLLRSSETKSLLQHLQKSFSDDSGKSIEHLFDEIRKTGSIDEETLQKSYGVVKFVDNLIKSGEIRNHKDVKLVRKLSYSKKKENLQEILAVLCHAVHSHSSTKKWWHRQNPRSTFWPRTTQMISWCLLVLSDTGRLLEMGTGEGKSCVIAMFAALRALRGEKVDVVSTSSVLCQRDAQEWADFYTYFGLSVDTNTDKTNDKARKQCYKKDVVYGTIEAFAADHLRQVFEMKDVRPNRGYRCIIIDEVDSLLLDQGVQLTYLSSPMVSMQHLNIILTMIWSLVSQYGFLSIGHQMITHGPTALFSKAIFDAINTEGTEIGDPMDVLHLAEQFHIVPEGFSKDLLQSKKDEIHEKLKTVSQDAVVTFFQEFEHYVPYNFTVYTLDDSGLLCLTKPATDNSPDTQELKFLVLEGGLCCPLYDSEDILIKPIADWISDKIQYTPCTNNKDKISIPGFLSEPIEKKMSVWVQNAFLAMKLTEGREYVIENDSVCPVDFRSTGIVELNKKWGDGLQQFVEIKHQIKLSTISTVTNYISNIEFFEKYQGQIYGTTGTLGSEREILLLQEMYDSLSACKMPTFNRGKLFEVKGSLLASVEDWKSEIKDVVLAQISPNFYRDGRAALVICETINKAQEIYEKLRGIVPGKIILYCRSDKDTLNTLNEELRSGDVIVATNLAGRGTDIKVSKQVNDNGGLFVVLSFLAENTRVEHQAFGRTARKGKPGSAQIVMTTDQMHKSFSTASSMEEVKKTRDILATGKLDGMMSEVAQMKLREKLFEEYCKTLKDVHRNTNGDEQRAAVAIMNEFWGIWLQMKSEDIDQLKTKELQATLNADLSAAKSASEHQCSPCSSVYHYIRFGNIAMDEKRWNVAARLFQKAIEQDESWAGIAFYNHAYCTIKQQTGDYLTNAKDDLKKAQESLKYLTEECTICLSLIKMVSAKNPKPEPSSLEKQLTARCTMFGFFDKNMSENIQKLEEIIGRGRDAVANKSPMFSLMSNTEDDLQVEAYDLYNQGLKYVYSVEEKPRFPWEALLVFCLGLLQIIGGTLLTIFTFGTLSEIGVGLIVEGAFDCFDGILGMVQGDFSLKSWAIEKSISFAISLLAFGIGKFITKGVKSGRAIVKGVKVLKKMPVFLSNQVKEGISLSLKTTMKTAVLHTTRLIGEQAVLYGLGKFEEFMLAKIIENIKTKVKEGIVNGVKSKLESQPLASLVDSIILSHVMEKQQLLDLLHDKAKKSKLVGIFRDLSSAALQPLQQDLSWQSKLNSSISDVIVKARSETKGTAKAILTAIEMVHMVSLTADAIQAVATLSSKFYSNLQEELRRFREDRGLVDKVQQNDLTPFETEMLREFRWDLAKTISASLADVLVEVFHQKFSMHFMSHVQRKVNKVISYHVRGALKTDITAAKLKAAQNSRYIAHMPAEGHSYHAGGSDELSHAHAEKIKNTSTPGTLVDARVLSETTGTKLVILTEDSHGKLKKMMEVNPTEKSSHQPVTLIYRPKSDRYPNGHYDVLINSRIVSVTSTDKSCLFHALARGKNPHASEAEIAFQGDHLRHLVSDSLLKNPQQWEPFIKRKEWTEAIRGGDWYMAEGGAPPIEETIDLLREEVGKVQLYREWKKYSRDNPGIGQVVNADHQPPLSSVVKAYESKKQSRLSKAFFEVATTNYSHGDNNQPSGVGKNRTRARKMTPLEYVKKRHGLDLLTVYVPAEMHDEFASTKSKACRTEITKAIESNDVVGTFKLAILGSMPRFQLKEGFKDFQQPQSATRLEVFRESFNQHSVQLVKKWYKLLRPTGVMTRDHLDTINGWINRKGYEDQNDSYRQKVAGLLKRNVSQKSRKEVPAASNLLEIRKS